MNVYGKSDIGLVRKTNQDDIKFKKVNENTLWAIVCDGMGGAKGGDVAGAMAVNKISEFFDNFFEKHFNGKLYDKSDETLDKGLTEKNDIKAMMTSSVIQAGSLIFDTSREDVNLSGMGTTVVAAIYESGILHIVHIGDSRAYLINNLGIRQLTTDHSMVQEMIAKGDITKEQAENHPQKNIITRALGIQRESIPDYTRVETNENDKFLFCTDGLTNELSNAEIYEIFKFSQEEQIADNLIKEAKFRKGADNITAAVMI